MPGSRLAPSRTEAVDELFAGLLQLSRVLRSRSVTWTRATPDLSRGDLVALGVIHDRGSIRPGQIAVALDVDPSVVSRQLATLARHGLITRGSDPADGRAELIEVTPAGRERMLAARTAMREMLTGRLENWEVDDIARATATLEELAAALHPAETKDPHD